MNKMFMGIFFLIAALFVILNQIGVFGNLNILVIMLTVLFAFIIMKSIETKSIAGIVVGITFLIILYKEQLTIEDVENSAILFTALLTVTGLSLIFDKKLVKPKTKK